MKSYEEVKIKGEYNGNIFCHCAYEWKENLKKLGFKWTPEVKLWYLPIKKFTKQIYDATQEVRYSNDSAIGVKNFYYVNYYDKYRLIKKINEEKGEEDGNSKIKHDLLAKQAKEIAKVIKEEKLKLKTIKEEKRKLKEKPSYDEYLFDD